MKYQLADGWTLDKIRKQIRKYNNGTRATDLEYAVDQCTYQTSEGNRCLIGCFIPDEHDGLDFQGNVSALLEAYPELQKHMPLEKRALSLFQGVHDIIVNEPENIHSRADTWLKEHTE